MPQTRAIFQVVNESMAAAARAHATDRGIDYAHAGACLGGAGPVHACHVAEYADQPPDHPPLASVLSAFGTVTRSGSTLPAASRDHQTAGGDYADMIAEAATALEAAGAPQTLGPLRSGADMRYADNKTRSRWISPPTRRSP